MSLMPEEAEILFHLLLVSLKLHTLLSVMFQADAMSLLQLTFWQRHRAAAKHVCTGCYSQRDVASRGCAMPRP